VHNVVVIWLLGCVQRWDEILPNGYKSSGLKSASCASKRPMWDGSFHKRSNVAKELQAGSVGYGASGELLIIIIYRILDISDMLYCKIA